MYLCPECNTEMFRDDCDVSSHGLGCQCRIDYYYCHNPECPKCYHSVHKSELIKVA